MCGVASQRSLPNKIRSWFQQGSVLWRSVRDGGGCLTYLIFQVKASYRFTFATIYVLHTTRKSSMYAINPYTCMCIKCYNTKQHMEIMDLNTWKWLSSYMQVGWLLATFMISQWPLQRLGISTLDLLPGFLKKSGEFYRFLKVCDHTPIDTNNLLKVFNVFYALGRHICWKSSIQWRDYLRKRWLEINKRSVWNESIIARDPQAKLHMKLIPVIYRLCLLWIGKDDGKLTNGKFDFWICKFRIKKFSSVGYVFLWLLILLRSCYHLVLLIFHTLSTLKSLHDTMFRLIDLSHIPID